MPYMAQRFRLLLALLLLMAAVLVAVQTAKAPRHTSEAQTRDIIDSRTGGRDASLDYITNDQDIRPWIVDLFAMILRALSDHDNSPGMMRFVITDPLLDKLFTAISVEGDNGPGNVATSAFTGSLKAAIPGKCYYYYLLQYPSLCNLYYQSFQYVFAPSYSKAPYQDEVTQYTGLSSSWWSDFSVAALCKAMYDLTTKLRPALNVDKITADISDYDEHLKGTWKYYAYVFMKENSQFSEAFGSLSADDIVKYRNMYIRDGLLSSTWIMAKKTQLSEGTWRDPGPTWEMFHHSIKLHLLGAGDADIDDVLNKLVDQGLLFPQEVRAANWREYFGWLDPDKILQSVKSDAAKGIMETRDCPWIVPCCFGSPEYQSFRFTESKQPGHKYRN